MDYIMLRNPHEEYEENYGEVAAYNYLPFNNFKEEFESFRKLSTICKDYLKGFKVERKENSKSQLVFVRNATEGFWAIDL